MVKNPLLQKWEDKLQGIFDKIDEKLENKYGEEFPLAPNRPAKGKGVTPDADGLFDLGVAFSVGLISEIGPGYVFRVKMATLANIPEQFTEKVEDEVVELLTLELPKEFPGKNLQVSRDGKVYRIHGDLNLN